MLRKVLSCQPRTSTPLDRSDEVRAALTAVEARRVARHARQTQAAVELALREKRNPRMLSDPKAAAVDWVMQRWAASHGSGLPVEDPGSLPPRVPALDDATAIIVDRIVSRVLYDSARKLVCQWYRANLPPKVIATRRGVSVRTLYRHWEVVLEQLRELFVATGHPDLVKMLTGV